MSASRIAIVGDVHRLWSERDEAAVRFLQPDAVLFVGDFGEEDVDLVQKIANFDYFKAVILGNHDAWNVGRSQATLTGVLNQLEALGKAHVGYGTLEVPNKDITIVGGRPFSWGGTGLRGMLPALQHLYGIQDLEDSAKRIVKVVKQVPAHHDVILMAHNGPTGLGDRAHDLCGVDFKPSQGDHGDPDLQEAMEKLKEEKIHVALMAFGHMHENLGRFPGTRRRVHVDPTSGTVYLNTAVVPRVKRVLDSKDSNHHFCMVELEDGIVTSVKDVWVRVGGNSGDDNHGCMTSFERDLLRRIPADGERENETQADSKEITWDVMDAYENEWKKVTATVTARN